MELRGSIMILLMTTVTVNICSDVIDVVEVKTPSGWVRGYKEKFDSENNGYRFVKLPFAKPPLGDLRFQKPQPIGQWDDTQGISKESGPDCMQPSFLQFNTDKKISEDCLYLNIYVPGKISKSRKLSVMVWIHGGGFSLGGGNAYQPQKMSAQGDVIVVTVNYRLGLFGYLPFYDTIISGNCGLWDQIEALRWVHQNIESFGGNSGSVTIFGESAGGISAHLLSLVPKNKGLFHRVISMSGTVSSMVIGRNSAFEKEVIKLISQKTNCPITDNLTIFLKCIQAIPAAEILDALSMALLTQSENFTIGTDGLAPTIDGELFPDNPMYMMEDESSDVWAFFRSLDFMSGTTDGEGSLLNIMLSQNQKLQESQNFSLAEGIPLKVLCDVISPSVVEYLTGNFPDMSKALCDLYTIDGDKQSQRIADMYGDVLFASPQARALNAHSRDNKKTNTYQYQITKLSPQPWAPQPSWFQGCGHGDEMYLLFPKMSNMENTMHEDDHKLSNQMIKYWTNFAKFGDPNGNEKPSWPTYDNAKKAYINLDTTISVGTDLKTDQTTLINSIMDKGRKKVSHDEL